MKNLKMFLILLGLSSLLVACGDNKPSMEDIEFAINYTHYENPADSSKDPFFSYHKLINVDKLSKCKNHDFFNSRNITSAWGFTGKDNYRPTGGRVGGVVWLRNGRWYYWGWTDVAHLRDYCNFYD